MPEESSSSANANSNGENDISISSSSPLSFNSTSRKRYRRRADWSLGPALDLSPDDALAMQMDALQINDSPYRDHGVEVLYRFADIDPFAARGSSYNGRRQDLGQFERFRRLFHAPGYAPLLGHGGYQVVGSIGWEGDEEEEGAPGGSRALRRVRVVPGPLVSAPAASAAAIAAAERGGETLSKIVKPAHFDWLLVQRVGGRADGVWFTASLTRSEFEPQQQAESESEEEGGEEEEGE